MFNRGILVLFVFFGCLFLLIFRKESVESKGEDVCIVSLEDPETREREIVWFASASFPRMLLGLGVARLASCLG
jgi:hypothetical protein